MPGIGQRFKPRFIIKQWIDDSLNTHTESARVEHKDAMKKIRKLNALLRTVTTLAQSVPNPDSSSFWRKQVEPWIHDQLETSVQTLESIGQRKMFLDAIKTLLQRDQDMFNGNYKTTQRSIIFMDPSYYQRDQIRSECEMNTVEIMPQASKRLDCPLELVFRDYRLTDIWNEVKNLFVLRRFMTTSQIRCDVTSEEVGDDVIPPRETAFWDPYPAFLDDNDIQSRPHWEKSVEFQLRSEQLSPSSSSLSSAPKSVDTPPTAKDTYTEMVTRRHHELTSIRRDALEASAVARRGRPSPQPSSLDLFDPELKYDIYSGLTTNKFEDQKITPKTATTAVTNHQQCGRRVACSPKLKNLFFASFANENLIRSYAMLYGDNFVETTTPKPSSSSDPSFRGFVTHHFIEVRRK